MANGDIPITGSAATGSGNQATFKINVAGGAPDDLNHLLVRTQGKRLHIRVNNGAGKIFDEDLEAPGWTLEIRSR